MKVRAPNWSKTGSQTFVRKKSNPNLWRGRTESRHNSRTSSRVTRTTEAANKNVITRAISSPSRSRERKERELAAGPALGTIVVAVDTLLHVVQRVHFFRDHFLGKLRVGKGLGLILSFSEHPLDEALHRIALTGIRELLRNQQPPKARNRVSRLARRVGDGHAEIVGHVRGSARGRRRHAR